MRRQLVPAIIAIVLFTVLTLVYSVGTTVVDEVLFPDKADGSLVKDASGKVVGSTLIGQSFTTPSTSTPAPPPTGTPLGPATATARTTGRRIRCSSTARTTRRHPTSTSRRPPG